MPAELKERGFEGDTLPVRSGDQNWLMGICGRRTIRVGDIRTEHKIPTVFVDPGVAKTSEKPSVCFRKRDRTITWRCGCL